MFLLFQLPLVLQIPRLLTSDTSVCLLPYSLLGFGDILVPGKLQFEFSLVKYFHFYVPCLLQLFLTRGFYCHVFCHNDDVHQFWV